MKRTIIAAVAAAVSVAAWALPGAESISTHTLQERQYTQVLTSQAGHGGNQAWQMIKADEAACGGEAMSSQKQARVTAEGWIPAIVPGTVLTSLVEAGKYPDPYFSDNNAIDKSVIPDLARAGRDTYTYWYRTELQFPSETYAGRRTWMQFDGINYRAEIWLNGRLLDVISGMFVEPRYDITDYITLDQTNVLAVKVYPVDAPGTLMPKNWGAVGEWHNGGDGEIGRNVTMLMSVGWDFTFHDGIRDRNTGIWKDVKIFTTGSVSMRYPFVRSELAHPAYDSAAQTVSVELHNPTADLLPVTVEGDIEGVKFSKELTLFRGERREVTFTPEEFPQLVFSNPRLWWPVNKGPQELYTLRMCVKQDGKVSDSIETRFGIREVTSTMDSPDGSRTFYVNGRRIFITGTNWIPEAMLRDSEERTYAQLRYTAQTGINMIRFWGGGITESEYFYQLCDELGILLWQEFWMTGDTRHPVDEALYLANVQTAVKRTRNHPSLAYYVSSNESTEVGGARELITTLDPTRGYQQQSECDGIHDGSPYKTVNPMNHYANNASDRGSRVDGFNPEYGAPCLPTVECLRETMGEKDLWPINKDMWDYHDGNGFHLMSGLYRQMTDEYGESSSIDEFAQKAQFVGAMNYKTILEVWRYNKLDAGDRYAAGYLFWYHNNPVRQVCGRMWDYSLEPTAALFAAQNATEAIHPQFDYLKNTVSAINDTFDECKGYKLTAKVYDLSGRMVSSSSANVDIPAEGAANDVLALSFPQGISSVHFIKLALMDAAGRQVGSNFYWRSNSEYEGRNTVTGPTTAGFQAINKLPQVKLKAVVTTSQKDGNHLIDIKLKNTKRSLAFFTQIQWLDAAGKPVRPSYYTDNFFSLLPGESKEVRIETAMEHLPAGTYTLVVGGFHQTRQTFAITIK